MKPCPFCGEAVALELETPCGDIQWVVCKTCNANGPMGRSKGEVWANWEHRPTENSTAEFWYQRGRVDALKDNRIVKNDDNSRS